MAHVPSTLLPGTKTKPLPANTLAGGQEGDNWPLRNGHDSRDRGLAANNPLGDQAIGRIRKRRSGRQRMPRSLGRYPFAVASRRYLEALKGHRADVTLEQLRRDVRTIEEDLRALRNAGRLRHANPYKMSVDDLAAVIAYWRTRPRRGKGLSGGILDPTSQAHLFRALKGLLEFCGNGAVGRLKTRPEVEIPRTLDKPIRALDDQERARLRAAADAIPGWHGAVARFLAAFCPATGLRPKEVRLQELACVDLERRRILVCHPKGEGRYATPHTEYAPIGEEAVEPFLDFLREREAFLGAQYNEALIPFRRAEGRLDCWPEAMMRKLKKKLEQASGVRFQIRTFRATFGQRALDGGARIEAVSRAMRHRTTRTTEVYYARVRPDRALQEVRQALSPAAVNPR